VILTKLAICLKANCAADDTSCAPTKCYVSKKGLCVTFNDDVFDLYSATQTYAQSRDAYLKFASGAYTEGCSEEATMSSKAVIAGN